MANINAVVSDIGICAEVLISLGARPIADFNENTDVALACANIYPAARDYLLARHEWHHAQKRVALSPDVTPPAFGYSQRFSLPADCLRILGVVALGGIGYRGQLPYLDDFTIEGNYLLCNYDAIGLHYIYRNDVAASWPPGFVHMLRLCLRWQLAMPITRDMATEAQCAQTFAAELRTHKTLDGIQTPGYELRGNDFLEARY